MITDANRQGLNVTYYISISTMSRLKFNGFNFYCHKQLY